MVSYFNSLILFGPVRPPFTFSASGIELSWAIQEGKHVIRLS